MSVTAQLTPPKWFHNLGRFVYRTSDRRDPFTLTFTSKSAHLKISKAHTSGLWKIRWIIYFGKRTGKVEGHLIFTEAELRTLFHLCRTEGDVCALDAEYGIKWGAEIAAPGLFVRSKIFANVPGPGTGKDGDPNISFMITKIMKEKVEHLIRTGRTDAV
jgi:hypothetical protein